MILIWTVGRTGGTSLTVTLRRLLGNPKTFHEPLNPGQVWDDLSSEESAPPDAVAALQARMSARPIVKHCVETVPWSVTEALLAASRHLDYRHVVLIRRDERSRSLSQLLMHATGAASREALEAMSTDDVANKVAVITKGHLVRMAAHSRLACQRLNRLHGALQATDTDHRVVAFEEVFQSASRGLENAAFNGLLSFLDIASDLDPAGEDAAFVRSWLVDAGQDSARYYPLLERRFGTLPPLESTLAFGLDRQENAP